MVASLPAMRWLPADRLSPLRLIHRVLAWHDGVSVGLVQRQVVWRCLGSPVARVWFPDHPDGQLEPMQLELTVFLSRHDHSPRWSDVVRLQPRRVAHHLPVRCPEEIDLQVMQWLQEAWDSAWRGPGAAARRPGAATPLP
jgi:hypothetical protein